MNFETVSDTGTAGLTNGTYISDQFKYPQGAAFNPIDSNLYVIEIGNNNIRKSFYNKNKHHVYSDMNMEINALTED